MQTAGLKNFLTKTKDEKFFPFVFLFCALIVIDQGVKYFIKNPFLNNNFAFSLPLPVGLMYAIYLVVLGGMIYYNFKNFYQLKLAQQTAWVFIFAGALSNIGERLLFGAVKDFIYIHLITLTGIYNLADFYIIFGILILLFIPTKSSSAYSHE